jgi:hypothetical protein
LLYVFIILLLILIFSANQCHCSYLSKASLPLKMVSKILLLPVRLRRSFFAHMFKLFRFCLCKHNLRSTDQEITICFNKKVYSVCPLMINTAKEISIYVFPEKELRGLSPNFYTPCVCEQSIYSKDRPIYFPAAE